MKKILRIATLALTVVLTLIVIFNVVAFIKRAVSNEPLPTVCGFATAIVLTGSMEPNISAGDMIIIHEQDDYNERQVIVYMSGTTAVTHRIISKGIDEQGKTFYVTQGDANNVDDGEIPSEAVVGRVILTLPGIGNLQKLLQTPQGFLILTLIVAALIVLPDAVEKIKDKLSKDAAPSGEGEK
jgi:signal peptidase